MRIKRSSTTQPFFFQVSKCSNTSPTQLAKNYPRSADFASNLEIVDPLSASLDSISRLFISDLGVLSNLSLALPTTNLLTKILSVELLS